MPGKILQVPFVKISVEDRAQDLLDRFSVEAAVQDFCITLSEQGVYRKSPQKIFVTDLKVRTLFKLSINDIWARPLLSSSGLWPSYLCFRRSNLISCERVAPDPWKSQFYFSFWRSNLISCERVATDTSTSQFNLSFWRSNLVSCDRVVAAHSKSQFYLSFWRSSLISCDKVVADTSKSQFYLNFWRSSLISCEKVNQFLAIEPRFVRRVAFPAVWLALPRAVKKRNRIREK